MQPAISHYGVPSLKLTTSPSERLYLEIRSRMREGHPAWQTDARVMANELARQTDLARGTVISTMQRLIDEGFLEVHRGKGYRIVRVQPKRRSTTLLSVSEFCQESNLECVTVLDAEACKTAPLRQLSPEVGGTRDERRHFETRVAELLEIDPDDRVLFVRRVRGWRPRGSDVALRWTILETLFLVAHKIEGLEKRIKSALAPLSDKNALGNLSLHRWMTSEGIELERSEYSLTLSRLSKSDEAAWDAVRPKPAYPSKEVFIRLRAVTYGKGLGPLLYTTEYLVPNEVDLQVSGFQFGLPGSNIFP